MVRVGGEAGAVWKGDVLVARVLEFGKVSRSEGLGILRGDGVGFCVNFSGVLGGSSISFGCGMKGKNAGGFGEIGERILSDFGGLLGLGLQ